MRSRGIVLVLVIVLTAVGCTTQTIERTPQECLDAIDAARHAFDAIADYAAVTSDYPSMVHDAVEAGMEMDATAVEDILVRMLVAHEATKELEFVLERSDWPTLATACEEKAS